MDAVCGSCGCLVPAAVEQGHSECHGVQGITDIRRTLKQTHQNDIALLCL